MSIMSNHDGCDVSVSAHKLIIKNWCLPFVVLLFWFVAFYEDLASAMRVWSSSDTFTHCFFILPGAIYLIWCERSRLSVLSPRPNLWLVFLLLPLLCLGLFGVAGDIQLFSHIAMFASLPVLIWLFVGSSVAKVIWFPLLFILFSIPIGGELVPLFQQLTANMAISLLNISDIPVYRDGLYLSIPAGRFVVAEACSGIRFFIACLAFGAIYAHLSFHSLRLKALYMLIAIVVPVLANGLRVYGTILIGHFIGMEYADGADHLIFGWGFFAFIMLLMVGVGELVRKFETEPPREESNVVSVSSGWFTASFKLAFIVSVVPLLIFILMRFLPSESDLLPKKINRDMLPDHSELVINGAVWKPQFLNASDAILMSVTSEGSFAVQYVEMYIAWYKGDRPGAELVSGGHRLFNNKRWSLISEGRHRVSFDDDTVNVRMQVITSGSGQKRIVFYWYELHDRQLDSRIMTKIAQAWSSLIGDPNGGGVVVMSLPYSGEVADAKQKLEAFVVKNYSDISATLPFAD